MSEFISGLLGPTFQSYSDPAYEAYLKQRAAQFEAAQRRALNDHLMGQANAARPTEVHEGDLKIIDVEFEEVKPVLLLPAPEKPDAA